ncbi:hypothetical protein HDV05_006022 [Chytridiales sp. JEL 0842]|nr:hypothetical protein HDV05_006022 [Chytridiales sp. JEL 0842]
MSSNPSAPASGAAAQSGPSEPQFAPSPELVAKPPPPSAAPSPNESIVAINNSIVVKPGVAYAYAQMPYPPNSNMFEPNIDLSKYPDAWMLLLSLNPAFPNLYLRPTTTLYLKFTPEENLILKEKRGDPHNAFLFGRHRGCDIVSSNPLLSKKHCMIYRTEVKRADGTVEQIVRLEDMSVFSSTNGIYINGERLPKGTSIELKDGDEIQLAKYDPLKRTEKFNDRFWMVKFRPKKEELADFEDDFELIENFGTGGRFHTVGLAKNRNTGHAVAVMRMGTKLLQHDPVSLRTVHQALNKLTRIKHTCIVNIEKFYHNKNILSLIMDLAKGGELFDRLLTKRCFTETEARTVMIQVLLALEHMHANNITHRDFKLRNILLLSKLPTDLRLKISDFGVAKVVGEEAFMRNILAESLDYVAPEALAATENSAESQVDLWSAGVALYIMLCGYAPFSPELAPPSLSDQIKNGRIFFQSPYWDNISPQAKDLVSRLLTVDPANRLTATQALEHEWTAKVDAVMLPVDPEFKALFDGYRKRVKKIWRDEASVLKRKDVAEDLMETGEDLGSEGKKMRMG